MHGWGWGVESHQADGLWAEPEKDSLPPGKDSHTSWRCWGIVLFGRIPRTGKVNVGVLGVAHPLRPSFSRGPGLG